MMVSTICWKSINNIGILCNTMSCALFPTQHRPSNLVAEWMFPKRAKWLSPWFRCQTNSLRKKHQYLWNYMFPLWLWSLNNLDLWPWNNVKLVLWPWDGLDIWPWDDLDLNWPWHLTLKWPWHFHLEMTLSFNLEITLTLTLRWCWPWNDLDHWPWNDLDLEPLAHIKRSRNSCQKKTVHNVWFIIRTLQSRSSASFLSASDCVRSYFKVWLNR